MGTNHSEVEQRGTWKQLSPEKPIQGNREAKKVFYDQELSQMSLIASNSSGACDPVV